MTVAPASTATPSVAAYHPLLGVAAVVVGAFISTINTRVTTVGLADIRGGLSLGFDEGSWLSTAFGAAQMVVCLSAAWFSIVLGPRRILLWSSAIFLISSILPPLTRDPSLQLVLQIVRGLAVVERRNERLHDRDGAVVAACVAPRLEEVRLRNLPMA